jgi:hypothetical protein
MKSEKKELALVEDNKPEKFESPRILLPILSISGLAYSIVRLTLPSKIISQLGSTVTWKL